MRAGHGVGRGGITAHCSHRKNARTSRGRRCSGDIGALEPTRVGWREGVRERVLHDYVERPVGVGG